MRRDLAALAAVEHDLVVVGGGIYGAFIAWDAALRGLTVALLERDDFGAGTSSNSLKIIHGGLRYLQSLDFARMRESIRERAALLRIAPHLVRPQPFLLPTYGHFARGRAALRAALLVNEIVSFDRARAERPERRLPRGRLVSIDECRRLVPGLPAGGITGGALWYDAVASSTERLLVSVVLAAARAGACVANHVAAVGFEVGGGRVRAVRAEDVAGGERFEVRARVVVAAAGAWNGELLAGVAPARPRPHFVRGMNLVTRPVVGGVAVGVASRSAVDGRRGRVYFLVPWRDCSLVGTAYFPPGAAGGEEAGEREVEELLGEVNRAFPAAALRRDDVRLVHRGSVPATGRRLPGGDLELSDRPLIEDHARDGADGLLAVSGVKYTTARAVAARVIDAVFRKLGWAAPSAATDVTPVAGGAIEGLDELVARALAARPAGLAASTVRRLASEYGSEYERVMRHVATRPELGEPLGPGVEVVGAEVVEAAREEMALRLSDVVFRRTALGTAGFPGEDCLRAAAALAAAELGWDAARRERELDDTKAEFRRRGAELAPTR